MPTGINWCDEVWNPVTGCTKVSAGCANCYAAAVAKRFWKGRAFSELCCHEDRLATPLKWRKPLAIFVNSMSDLFHPAVPDEFIDRVFAVMAMCPRHTFIILTKRPERIATWSMGNPHLRMTRCFRNFTEYTKPVGPWPLPNVWLGVSIEDQASADERLPFISKLKCGGWKTVVSAEPLLGPIDLKYGLFQGASLEALEGLDCLIIGGESGPGARPCDPEWVGSLVNQAAVADVPCFLKQLGAHWAKFKKLNKKSWSGAPADTSGSNPYNWPKELRVRKLPWMVYNAKRHGCFDPSCDRFQQAQIKMIKEAQSRNQ